MRGAGARRTVTRLPTATKSGLCRSSPGSCTPRRYTKLGISEDNISKSGSTLVREHWAWEWARANALIWTPDMENSARKAMKWYNGTPPGLIGPIA